MAAVGAAGSTGGAAAKRISTVSGNSFLIVEEMRRGARIRRLSMEALRPEIKTSTVEEAPA